MFKQIKKIIISVVILTTFQMSYALDLCSLEGDFVPWPWSEQYYEQVVSQNWIIVNANGVPISEVSLSKSNILWGWGRDVFTLVEKDVDGHLLRWGMATENKENGGANSLKFNMWEDEIYPTAKQTYTVQMGYWSSSKGQMTIDEEEVFKNSPNLVQPFNAASNKVCKSFRQRTDRVIGLVLDIELESADGIQTQKLFGLTQDPIYAQN